MNSRTPHVHSLKPWIAPYHIVEKALLDALQQFWPPDFRRGHFRPKEPRLASGSMSAAPPIPDHKFKALAACHDVPYSVP